MLTRYERMVAFRYLRPNKGEGSIFFIVSVGVLVVAVGVAALIAVMSIMNGFRAELFDRILSLNGHAIIQGYDNKLPAWREVVAAAKATPGVTSATPLIEQPLMASARGRVEGVLVRGMEISDIKATDVLGGTLVDGDFGALEQPRTVALGAELATKLGLRVGDNVTLIAPEGAATPFGTAPRIVSYQIGAIFRIGIYDFDKAFIVMRLDEAQTLLRTGDSVGMIEVNTTDPDKAPAILLPLAEQFRRDAVVTPWQATNSQLFEALQVEQVAMFWILSIIIVVAVINILSSLVMLVRAKARDIAILRTMGASRAAMMRIFVGAGTMIGLLGIVAGLALGLLVLNQRQGIVNIIQTLTGANLWDPSVRFLSELPAKTDPGEVAAVVILALVLSVLATIYPAWRAASTDPVTVLRYE